MPIRPSLRWLYPIDWPQLSRVIRFGRARGRGVSFARVRTAQKFSAFQAAAGSIRMPIGGATDAAGYVRRRGALISTSFVPPASSWRPPIWTTTRPTTLSPT